MNRISFVKTFFFVTLLSTVSSISIAQTQPNILIIFTDDQGSRDVGCYGSEFATPHIDRLATEGMRFTNFYSASAICTPSRFGLLTGRNPSRSHDRMLSALMFHDSVHAKLGIHSDEITLPSLLKDSGYQTALLGKWHLGHGDAAFSPLRHGFDYWYGHTAGCVDYFTLNYGITPDWYRNDVLLNEGGYATELITNETISYLEKRNQEKPFFLFLAYNAPHFGKGWDDGNDEEVNLLQPHPDYLERVSEIADPARRKYAAMVASLDDGIGKVLKYLDETGLAKNTIIIFMSDHGGDPNYGGDNKPLRAGKATLFEGGIKIPCIVRWPGHVEAGTVNNDLAWSLDWFPTLASLSNVKAQASGLDGQNITDLLGDKKSQKQREMYWELGNHAELDRGHWIAYRKGNWKYVTTPKEGEWLFDLSRDPFEKNNLKDNEPETFNNLKRKSEQLGASYKKFSEKK